MLLFFIMSFGIGFVYGYVTTRYARYKFVVYLVVITTLLLLVYNQGFTSLNPFATVTSWYEFGLGFVGVLLGISVGEWYAKKRMRQLPTM